MSLGTVAALHLCAVCIKHMSCGAAHKITGHYLNK